MSIKMKGIYKGFKYITQIFVAKEKEMEIGYPTDVKHVTHIGSDTSSCSTGTAPSWMNVFKTASDFSATSQDFDPSVGRHQAAEIMLKDFPPTVLSNIPKKHARKKTRPTSPKCSASRSFRNGFNSRARILEMAI